MNEMARSRWTRDGYAHGCRDYDLPGTWLAVITRVVCLCFARAAAATVLVARTGIRRPPNSLWSETGGNPDQTNRADWADTYMSRRVRSTRITPSPRSRSPPARGRARSYAAQGCVRVAGQPIEVPGRVSDHA